MQTTGPSEAATPVLAQTEKPPILYFSEDLRETPATHVTGCECQLVLERMQQLGELAPATIFLVSTLLDLAAKTVDEEGDATHRSDAYITAAAYALGLPSEDEARDTCQHKSNEDCMNCSSCGKCREDLDSKNLCPDCGGVDENDHLLAILAEGERCSGCNEAISAKDLTGGKCPACIQAENADRIDTTCESCDHRFTSKTLFDEHKADAPEGEACRVPGTDYIDCTCDRTNIEVYGEEHKLGCPLLESSTPAETPLVAIEGGTQCTVCGREYTDGLPDVLPGKPCPVQACDSHHTKACNDAATDVNESVCICTDDRPRRTREGEPYVVKCGAKCGAVFDSEDDRDHHETEPGGCNDRVCVNCGVLFESKESRDAHAAERSCKPEVLGESSTDEDDDEDEEYQVTLTLHVTAADPKEAVRFFLDDATDRKLTLNYIVEDASGDTETVAFAYGEDD